MIRYANTKAGMVVVSLWIALLGLFAGGWIANVIKLCTMGTIDFYHLQVSVILRFIGVFIPPLGAIMGYIPT